MTNRVKLLAAVAAMALPAAMAGAQGTEHRPLGQPSTTSTRSGHQTPCTTQTPAPTSTTGTRSGSRARCAAPTANTATEDTQTNAPPPADAPATVNQNAEPGTQADTATQAAAQAQATPPATPPQADQPAPAAQGQAATQAQAAPPATPPADQPAPAAQAHTATQAQTATQTPPTTAAPAAQAQAAATPPAAAAPVRVATAADLHAGVQVRDQAGGVVGTVESADASGAVVSTGTVRARLPLTSFGTNGQNLVISMTRGQLEAAAAHPQAQPSSG